MSSSQRVLASLVIASALLAAMPAAAADPAQAPRVVSFSLSATTLAPGDTLTLQAETSEPANRLEFWFLQGWTYLTAEGPASTNTSFTSSLTIPSGIPGGVYPLVFTYAVDHEGNSHQNSENLTYPDGSPVTITIDSPDFVDFDPAWISVQPGGVPEGNQTRLVAGIHNGGTVTSSTGARFLMDGTFVAYAWFSDLGADETRTMETVVSLAPGAHTFQVQVDPDAQVPESDETDNVFTYSFSFGEGPMPDLVSSAYAPENATAGQRVSLSGTSLNVGNATAAENSLRFTIDGEYAGHVRVGPLGPSELGAGTVSWVATAGWHTLSVESDAGHEVPESNEANMAEVPFYVGSTPPPPPTGDDIDLTITNISLAPSSPIAGDVVRLDASIWNIGNGSAPTVAARFYLDETMIGAADLQLSGHSGTMMTMWSVPSEGAHIFRVVVDQDASANETDETNNVAELAFYVRAPPLPDLAFVSLSASPAGPGERVYRLDARVTNQGNASATDVPVRLLLDGAFRDQSNVTLAPGEAVWVTTFDTLAPGEHVFSATIDPASTTPEANELNNEGSFSFVVEGQTPADVDLAIVSLDVSPSQTVVGQEVQVDAIVANLGADATPATQVFFLVNGALRDAQSLAALGAGEATNVTMSFTPVVAGSYEVRVVVDPEQEVVETNETNNERSSIVDIASPPRSDLIISLLAAPSGARAGDNTSLVASVANTGEATADASTLRLTLDGGWLADFATPSLAPGANATFSLAWRATAGQHTLVANADADDNVSESDEGNNSLGYVFDVAAAPPSDLVISWIDAPFVAHEEDVVALTARVKNIGNGTAPDTVTLLQVGNKSAYLFTRSLGPGQSADVTLWWTATPGWHSIIATADAWNQTAETNESNNARSDSIYVFRTYHDLRATLGAIPSPVIEGSTVWVTGTVTNDGDRNVTDATAQLSIGNVTHEARVASLAPGESIHLAIAWTADASSFAVLSADPDDTYAEDNEWNNVNSSFIKVLPRQDIAVDIVDVAHEKLRTELGDAPHPAPRHTIRVLVTNHDARPATALLLVVANATVRGPDTPTGATVEEEFLFLAPGESRLVSIVWDPVALGDVRLKATVALYGGSDPVKANNVDTLDDFFVVGGLGGVVAPVDL